VKHADGLTALFFLKLRCSVIWIKKLDMHRRNPIYFLLIVNITNAFWTAQITWHQIGGLL